jgi:hypothetical protein
MPGFHSHDDDFLYEFQNNQNFRAEKVTPKRSRRRASGIDEWNSMQNTIQKQQIEIARLRGILAKVKNLLQTLRDSGEL